MTTSYQLLDLLEKIITNSQPGPDNPYPRPLMVETLNALAPYVSNSYAASKKHASICEFIDLLFDADRTGKFGGAENVREYMLHDIDVLRSLIRLY